MPGATQGIGIAYTSNALNRSDTSQYTAGEESFSRYLATGTITMTSQVLRLAFFTALSSRTVTSVSWYNIVAAAATPTLGRAGLYTVAADGGLTALVASTTNDTALFTGTTTFNTKSLTASYDVSAGTRYAVGLICVTAATAPQVGAGPAAPTILTALAPRLAAGITGQADLPAGPVAAANVNTLGTGTAPWMSLNP